MFSALRRILSRLRRDERGSVMVEMTLITPLMIGLSAGVFEFSNLFQRKLLIEAGLRDAGRYASRCNPAFSGLTCDANAINIAVFGTVAAGTARVSGWAASDVTISYYNTTNTVNVDGTQDYRGSAATVKTVRLVTSYPYPNTSLLTYLGIGPITLTAAHEERVTGW